MTIDWTYCKDKEPDDLVNYIISNGYDIFLGYYDKFDGIWYISGIGYISKNSERPIIAYMKYPELPKLNKS